VGTLCVSWSTG